MKCPICAQETVEVYKPFCSKLCANRDLLSWLNEDYRVPIDETIVENKGDDNA